MEESKNVNQNLTVSLGLLICNAFYRRDFFFFQTFSKKKKNAISIMCVGVKSAKRFYILKSHSLEIPDKGFPS